MRLVLLGPAGAGKGTQARLLSERLGAPHISTGEILRHEIDAGSELGKIAKELIDDGNLVSDEIVNALVIQRLQLPDTRRGFILDGYPRTVPQAEALLHYLKDHHQELTAVIDLEVNEEEIIRRLSGRMTCSGCGANFHKTSMPPITPGVCDYCGSPLIHRKDDSPEAIAHRLQHYRQKTQPLIDYYRGQRKLITIDARHGVERTFEAISRKLGLDGGYLEDL
ncbi:MAG: adenylate kinase [Armatimonadetes bacterium]|nr:adenylate kinase [Armatimonadota bacterium]